MFGRRRRGWGGGGGGGGNLGLFLLFFQLINFVQFLSARNEFLPATLCVLGLNIVAFIRPNLGRIHWPSVSSGCISLENVYYQKHWDRIILSPFLHADSFHLYYNMASFMWKARTLERHYGSSYFAYMVAVFSVLTSVIYLVLNLAIGEMLDICIWSYVRKCAVGFSGVIFALKVVTTHLTPPGTSFMINIPITSRLLLWAELVIISVLVPRASFVGHLAGILVGVTFVSGPLKQIMDLPLNLLQSQSGGFTFAGRQSYTYAARTTGYRGGDSGGAHSTREPVRSGILDSQQERRERESSEERQLQQAIEASLQEKRRRVEEERRGGSQRPPPYNPGFGHASEESSNPRYLWQSRTQQEEEEEVEEQEEEEEKVEEQEEEEEEELTRRRLRELRLRRFTGQRN